MEDLQFQLNMVRSLNQQLNGKEKMYQLVCSTSRNAFLYVDFHKKEVSILGNWKGFFDFTIEKTDDILMICDVVDDSQKGELRKLLLLEKYGERSGVVECHMSDSGRWVEFECTVMYDKEQPVEKVIRIRDITVAKKQNDELRYMAYYDMLTGLYNRNYFVSVLSDWIRNAENDGDTIAVMCLEIDNFKKINDGLGLVAGDELIQSFGLFLKGFMDGQTIVAHVTDDTYYLAIRNPVGSHSADNIFEAIVKRVEEPFVLMGGHEIYVTVCAGIAEFPEAATNSLELINCSEIVMFRSKENGPNSMKYFEAPIFEDFIENISIENKLKEAVNMNRFLLYYQPQYDSLSGKLRGVEALVRWQDETGKLISPGVFIPIAEKSGMIVPIGAWVLEEGIQKYAEWREKYNCDMILSLNISAIQYKRPDFVNNLLELLEKYKVNPKDIELEITESVLIDDFEQVVSKLRTLKEYGIKISLDDFGTGYSSLSYLKGLPIDTLKIDKSFIDTVTEDKSTQVITESIVSMVKKLGYETVAEGVETEEQFEYLKKIECDNIQGYLLGKPMPADGIADLLENEAVG
ncbi:MAG: GGDEF domain-containing protein [Lachnospiraceae bacterium]|nr:GGDEF domain-containing protein [Lachnospiraceae bacterium]